MILYFNNYKYDTHKNIIAQLDYDFSNTPAQEGFYNSDSHYKQSLDELYLSQNLKPNFDPIMIEEAGIAPTLNCGLRCNYCSQSSVDGILDTLSKEDIELFVREIIKKKVIESFATEVSPSLSFIITGGGEPTYNWDLFTFTITIVESLCRENDIKVDFSMTTNGILSDVQRKFIAEHISDITVSYDGTSDLQNSNRKLKNGKDSSEIVEKTISYLLNSKKVKVSIRSTVWHNNFAELKRMAVFIKDRFEGLSSWEIYPVVPAGRAIKAFLDSQNDMKQSNFVDYFLEIKELFNNSKTKIRSPLLSHKFTGFQCGGIGSIAKSLWLTPKGKIVTCIDSSDIITEIGYISNSTIQRPEHYEDMLLNMGIKKYIECRECPAFPVCGSGCPIHHVREERYHTGMMKWACDMECYYWTYVLTQLVKNGEYENLSLIPTDDPNVFTIKEN